MPHDFMFSNVFSENRAGREIMSKNMVQPEVTNGNVMHAFTHQRTQTHKDTFRFSTAKVVS
jgi:hypothetical protein